MNELVLASGNKGKLREFNALFGHRSIKVLSQAELGVKAAEEPFNTFVENALAKARNAARQTGLPAMADDSGITAETLNGTPGVHSARYAGDAADDIANNRKLVAALAGKTDRRAHYTCVLVAVKNADDPEPVIVDARWDGEIIDTPKGTGGFGYDPYFYLPQEKRTAAELSQEEKNAQSHRGEALRRMAKLLEERWGWKA